MVILFSYYSKACLFIDMMENVSKSMDVLECNEKLLKKNLKKLRRSWEESESKWPDVLMIEMNGFDGGVSQMRYDSIVREAIVICAKRWDVHHMVKFSFLLIACCFIAFNMWFLFDFMRARFVRFFFCYFFYCLINAAVSSFST